MKPSREGAVERLIVALDMPTAADVFDAFTELYQKKGVQRYKIGLELFTAEGPAVVKAVRSAGGRVMLDLKLHDIPETVRRSARNASLTGAELITAHCAGGKAMLEAAVAGAKEGGHAGILGVTVLTSENEHVLASTGVMAESVLHVVMMRARLAKEAGCVGVVASAQEAAEIRAEFGPNFLIVTPAVRFPDGDKGDQVRVTTPELARAAGADAVVVGRPIYQAKDRSAAVDRFLTALM